MLRPWSFFLSQIFSLKPYQILLMSQTLYRQSHWNGENWVHAHIYIRDQEKRLALYGFDTVINTSTFLSICTSADKFYLYDYGSDALYECSIYDPLTSDESLSSQLHAIRLNKTLILRQLRLKVCNDKSTLSTSPSSPGFVQKPLTPLLKRMRNMDTLQPYEHLISRSQSRSITATPVVSASICTIDQDTLMILCVQREFVHGKSVPIYTNHLFKVSLTSNDTEKLKLQSQFERVHSLIYHKGNLYAIAEQGISLPKTEEDLQEERRRAEELTKIMKHLSKMDPEDEEYKRLEPYYRSSIEPFETVYTLCRIDINTFSVETIMRRRVFIKAFVDDMDDNIIAIMPTCDLSSTITLASYNVTTRELNIFHPTIDQWFVIDRTMLESSYLEKGVLRNPALSLEIELSPTTVYTRQTALEDTTVE